jgi:hypothetical protein
MDMDRARLTFIDVIFLGISLAVLAILARPLYSVLDKQADVLSTGEAYMFQLLVPGIVATLLIVMLATAVNEA